MAIYTSTHTQTEIDNGVDNAICYGTSSTGASTAQKSVTVSTGSFSLTAGRKIVVKFSNANTAGTPTLKVGTNAAKNIYSKGSQITTGSNKALIAGVCEFIYDGTQFHLIGSYIDTTYSSKTAASGGNTLSLCTTGEKYNWNGKQATISDLSTIRSGASAGATAYQKPNGGIPKSDMASAVQTSLGKADAAAPQSTTYTKTEVNNLLAGKQATLTFDTAPQAGSTKPVTSNGIYSAIQNAAVTVAYSGDFQGIVGTTNFNNY